jgi:hypothetical protein
VDDREEKWAGSLQPAATQTTIKLVSREEMNDVLILHPTYIVNYYIS